MLSKSARLKFWYLPLGLWSESESLMFSCILVLSRNNTRYYQGAARYYRGAKWLRLELRCERFQGSIPTIYQFSVKEESCAPPYKFAHALLMFSKWLMRLLFTEWNEPALEQNPKLHCDWSQKLEKIHKNVKFFGSYVNIYFIWN